MKLSKFTQIMRFQLEFFLFKTYFGANILYMENFQIIGGSLSYSRCVQLHMVDNG